jgi:protein-disulfide isomerase
MKLLAPFVFATLAVCAQKPLVEGNPSSPVRVVIFEDLQCPDCADFRAMMDKELLPRFAKTVAFEHRDFPLAKHPWARPAAIAARFFETVSPETAVEFRQATMRQQDKITPETFEAHVASFAKSHKVDPAKALAALHDPALAARVEDQYQDGVARGIARTPTVLVDGEPFIEQFPAADIIKSIEQALAATAKTQK